MSTNQPKRKGKANVLRDLSVSEKIMKQFIFLQGKITANAYLMACFNACAQMLLKRFKRIKYSYILNCTLCEERKIKSITHASINGAHEILTNTLLQDWYKCWLIL